MDLDQLLPPSPADDRVLVGLETRDDAGVVRLRDDLALVSTVDLITPVADDPYVFGQIAAANSLSDVYAMGGAVLGALNVCCFPERGPAPEALARILEGGMERLSAAGGVLLGGHTVRDPELKYGMSVTGTIHPERIVRNHTVRTGDLLVLTKGLGTGLLLTAHKKGLVDDACFGRALESMARLNRAACEAMLAVEVHAATDVTGFGLLGHLFEMLHPGGHGVELHLPSLPLYDGAREAADALGVSGPMRRNLALPQKFFDLPMELSSFWTALLADPQTSGGLLMAVDPQRAGELLDRLRDAGEAAALIGEVRAHGATSSFPV